MRIAYTVLNGRMAGGQMVCWQMMRAASDAGHEVCLIVPSKGEFTDLVEAEGMPVSLLPMTRTFHFHRSWHFARFLRRWDADLVHCHDAVAGTILARAGAWMAGVPLISHVHIQNKFSGAPWVRRYQVALDNVTARLADEIIAISHSTGSSLIEQGIPPARVRVIPNGILLPGEDGEETRRRSRAALGLDPDTVVVGCVARLCPIKGQRELLLAAASVHQRLPDVQFAFIGEDLELGGRYRAELEALSNDLGLPDRVRFTGFRKDAARLMYAFDLFVLPSHLEGLPVTILEAMAAGRPVVATPVGGVPELVIDGKTGLLVPPGDPDRLAAAIVTLLRDPERAAAMGRAGRARVAAEFSLERVLDEVLDLYVDVVSRRRRARGSADAYDRH